VFLASEMEHTEIGRTLLRIMAEIEEEIPVVEAEGARAENHGTVHCKWCEAGDMPKRLDKDGVRARFTGELGSWFHAEGDSWWPCPKFNASHQAMVAEGVRAALEKIRDDYVVKAADDAEYYLRFILETKEIARAALASQAPAQEGELKLTDLADSEGRESAKFCMGCGNAWPESCTCSTQTGALHPGSKLPHETSD